MGRPRKLKRFSFVVAAEISLRLDVDAASLKEAVELAEGTEVMTLCNQCASFHPDVWSTTGDLDTDPTGAKLVECYQDDRDIDISNVKWNNHG